MGRKARRHEMGNRNMGKKCKEGLTDRGTLMERWKCFKYRREWKQNIEDVFIGTLQFPENPCNNNADHSMSNWKCVTILLNNFSSPVKSQLKIDFPLCTCDLVFSVAIY